MSNEKNENLLVSTYIKRHEAVLLEHIRKQLDAEARNILLEMAVNEQNRLIEDQNNTISSLQDTVDQSISGLQVATLDRDNFNREKNDLTSKFSKEREDLLNQIKSLQNEKNNIRNHANSQDNRVAILQNEINHLNNKVQIAGDDYSTLKENYSRVLAAFEEANKKIEQLEAANTQEPVIAQKQKKRPKKAEETESEWVDGEYKIST
jgi:chromosome segregation ATPase